MRKYFLSWLLIITSYCFAQNLPVKFLGIENGLSNNAVTCIYKDYNGFMWFATYDGLNKYDGSSFTIFRNRIDDSTSLVGNEVYTITSDLKHNLWIGGRNGACIYHPATNLFSPIRYLPLASSSSSKIDFTVSGIYVQKNGFIFIASIDEGVLIFNPDKEIGQQIALIDGTSKRIHYKVNSIRINDKNNDVWLFVDDVGLCKYDKKNNTVNVVNRNARQGNCLEIDNDQNLWLGSNKGLYKYMPATNTFSDNYFNGNYRITDLYIAGTGVLWIASDGKGVLLMDLATKKLKPLLSADGKEMLNSSSVLDLFEDEQGRKWISTLRGGINVIESKENPFKSVVYNDNKIKNPNINFVSSFAESADGNIWIGSNGSGLRCWNRNKNTYTFYANDANNDKSLRSNLVTSVIEDYKKNIWASTWYGGINRFDKASNTFKHYSCFNSFTDLEEKQVWFLYEDKDKNLWASTSNDGTLYSLNRTTDRFDLFDPALINIQCLAEDKEGNLWGGNYSSLIKIDKKNKKHITYHIGYTVRSIHEDKYGNFWVATQGGGLLLFNRKDGTYKRFDEAKGLQSNTILRILEDSHGNLWMSSFTGLIKYDAQKKSFIKFSKSDGLQSNQFSFNGATTLKSGEFLFGGIKGFNIFYPDSVYTSAVKPNVFLTGVHINGEPIEANINHITNIFLDKVTELTIPYDKAYISLDFVAPEYGAPDKIRYSYYLEGWDKKFNTVNLNHTVTYSHLPEGTYYFKVKVTDILGIWGEETQLLKIKVLPPWYRSWWAYLFYLGLATTLIYLYVTYKSNQHRLKYEVNLAMLTAEKEKELTEKRISFFTHISHEFRTPLTLIINPLKEIVFGKNGAEEDKRLTVVYRNARRLLSLVDQLLLFRKVEAEEQQLKIEKFGIADLCNEVYLCFQQHAVSKNIHFSIEGIESKTNLIADKEKIEIILFNLLSNAFKFTPNGGIISLRLTEKDKQVEIFVSDNGCGISKEASNRMFQPFYQVNAKDSNHPTGFGIGLYLSRKLAEANGGTLHFVSEESIGTTFVLTLPKPDASITDDISVNEIKSSSFLQELVEDVSIEKVSLTETEYPQNKSDIIHKLTSDLPAMLIVDDNKDMRDLLKQIFKDQFIIYEAVNGEEGYECARKEVPEIIISDIMMGKMSGIELCAKIKSDTVIGHIPVILLTASLSTDSKLKGLEGGAEDYITKPFENEIIVASVKNILKRRNRLQQYFFNAVTLQPNFSIASEYKEFIEKCIEITEKHMDDPDFTIKTLSREIGMSHPKLYKKVKSVSGLSVNVFIRYLRLRKAAELLINTNKTINEVTYEVGFRDIKYFREQFNKLFTINPSEYIKRYRKPLGNKSIPQ
jgi:signal transduction histidine kinase/ligand-binding sensor domain-containing protein/DNA-binding response OmpR family regulator